MTEQPITDLPAAVAELGALPMPTGSAESERDRLRSAFVAALDEAHKTHPCPVTGSPYWTGCVHYDEAGRVAGVGSCHSERRADAVLAVRDAEVEFLLAEVDQARAERDEARTRLSAVLDLCDREERNATRWENPIPVPEWVATVQKLALGDAKPGTEAGR